MQIYLVGGAVRDQLLKRPVTERDWVVVGATPQQMLALGYQAVGKDFPVFLHPQTKEEYALARTERKSGRGYHGFVVDAGVRVTLEQDLARRDLTINAIAQDAQGQLIDPYGGLKDLAAKQLRHVSPAFVEDPVRVLRVARFAARFARLGFQIAEETWQLMRDMVNNGEIDYLVADRVWLEWHKTLTEGMPQVFLQVLQDCGALPRLFPMFESLLTQNIEAFDLVHQLVKQQTPVRLWFAALCGWLSSTQVDEFCQRYPVPKIYQKLALACAQWLHPYQQMKTFTPQAVLQLIMAQDALRQPQRLLDFLTIANAYHQTVAKVTDATCWSGHALFINALRALQQLDLRTIAQQYQGEQIKTAVYQRRLACVTRVVAQW
nr:multifunctional CCA tRNA nucleotidyl transferase/2'3'-cyclic phosphodiesterase/2'nucleotidase/phosphatase [Legionellales bacterium]